MHLEPISPDVRLKSPVRTLGLIVGILALAAGATAAGPSQFRATNIPRDAFDQLQILDDAGISAFAVAPNGGWAIVTNDGRVAMDRTPPDFDAALRDCVQRRHRIFSFAFTRSGGWTILTDQTYKYSNIPPTCLARMQELVAAGGKLVGVAYGQGDSWIVTSDRGGVFTNIPSGSFEDRVRAFVANGPITAVALAPDGGASAFANGTRFDASGVPADCFKSLQEASVAGLSIDGITLSPGGGWAVIVSRP